MKESRPSIAEADEISLSQYGEERVALSSDTRLNLYKYAKNPIDIHAEIRSSLWPYLRGDETVVDLGCGSAMHFLEELYDEGLTGRKIGINLSDTSFYAVQQRIEEEKIPDFQLIQEDVRHTKLPDDYADVVSALFLLYHVSNPQEVLKEMERILKPGGLAVVASRGIANLQRLWEFISRVADEMGYEAPQSFYRHFDLQEAAFSAQKYFTIAGEPFEQRDELQIPSEAWFEYELALYSLRDSFSPHPPAVNEMSALVNELVKPLFDEEIKRRGYFTDYVHQGFYIYRNS